MSIIWITVIVLGVTGVIAAGVLWFVAKKFFVREDPRIAQVEALLPGANCGSCGMSGCHAFAVACCEAESLDNLRCPGAGNAAMMQIAEIVGLAAKVAVPQVAVVKCGGSCGKRPAVSSYDGVASCKIENSLFSGESECVYGCLGCGDCARACPYDALHIDPESGLPVVNFDKCVGCGRCVDACPRSVMELIDNPGDKALVWVECNNRDKGAVAMKECEVSCIGCTKCKRVCPSDAVTMEGPLSRIDPAKCTGCGACVEACPRKCIAAVGELERVLQNNQ